MSKIYIPSEYLDGTCKVINNGYIRVYTNYNYNNWVDVYVNQGYMLKPGSSNYTQQPVCDTFNEYTDNIYYRNDIWQVFIVSFFLFGLWIFLLYKLAKPIIRAVRW